MPYVQRNQGGLIIGVFANPQTGYAEERLDSDNAELVRYLRGSEFATLSRPAFLFMMSKIGVTEAAVEQLIEAMPEGSQTERDAKALALIVFKNTTTFERANQLLNTLTAAYGLSSDQVDTAWRAAEQLTW